MKNTGTTPLSNTTERSGTLTKGIEKHNTYSNVELGDKEATLIDKGKILKLKVQGPDNIQMNTWSTAPTNNYDAANPGTIIVGFECEIPANTKESFEVILVPYSAEGEGEFLNMTLGEW